MDVLGYRFGHFYLDEEKSQLFKNDQPFEMHERSIQLLLLLAQSSPTPIDKKSLHEQLWPKTIVSDWSLSRLVSDTRIALGDDGAQQNVIKTARGEGFYLTEVETVTKNSVEETKHKRAIKMAVWATFTLTALALIGYWSQRYQQKQLYETIAKVKTYQDGSYAAFKAQIKRRTQLTQLIEERLNIKRHRQFEMFFEHYANKMTTEEKFVCQQMRAFSDTGIYNNNRAVLEAINAHPEFTKAIPLASQLAEHLRIWIDKYHSVFKQNPNMCLVYVGVEDGVPYPSEVDQQIKDWLANNKGN